MFEDWSPVSHAAERRLSFFPEDDEAHKGHARRHLPHTGAQLRWAKGTATALGLVIAYLAVYTWHHLRDHRTYTRPRPGADFHARARDGVFNATRLKDLDHLIMVAGHAVVLSESLDDIESQDTSWYLEGYQRDKDLPGTFVGHIRRGVEEAGADPRALLVFSGGQTRPAAGPRDEGFSYYRIAEHYGWWGYGAAANVSAQPTPSALGPQPRSEVIPVPERTVTEDFAADSFQNLMFSLCRFKEVVGEYPARVTVVSFNFKRNRFETLHRAALRFPRNSFAFVGLQPPRASRFNLAEAERGEAENSAQAFQRDPYGCYTPGLVAKREARNPFRRTTPYPLSCQAIKGLLQWCGPGLYTGSLPWSLAGPLPA